MDQTITTKALAKIGYTFLDIQLTEQVVKRAIQIAMPDDKKLFSSLEEKLSPKELARPLGVFLTELRKRASLNGEVDLLLNRYLVNRNIFIHDIVAPEGWSLKNKEGLNVVNMQLESLINDSREIRNIFTGLIYAWKLQMDVEASDHEEKAFNAICGKYEGGIMAKNWNIYT